MISGGRNYGGDVYLYNAFLGHKDSVLAVMEAKKRIREIVETEPDKAKEEGFAGVFRDPPRIEVVSEGNFTRISWRATMILCKDNGEKPDIWERAFGEGEK